MPDGSNDLEPGPCLARIGRAAWLMENDDPMQDSDAPPRRSEGDDAETTSAEARMRLALEQMGTRSSPSPGGPGGKTRGTAATSRAMPRPPKRFVRDGEVPVVRVAPATRLPSDVGRELAEERAARERAEQVLADTQATVGRLQAARTRAEQVLQAAQAAVEERDAAMAGLRAELARAAQREAALTEVARVEAGEKRSRGQAETGAGQGTGAGQVVAGLPEAVALVGPVRNIQRRTPRPRLLAGWRLLVDCVEKGRESGRPAFPLNHRNE